MKYMRREGNIPGLSLSSQLKLNIKPKPFRPQSMIFPQTDYKYVVTAIQCGKSIQAENS
jgi:hypothetical protein